MSKVSDDDVFLALEQMEHCRLKNDLNRFSKLKIFTEGCTSSISMIINDESED